jgi:LAO/AO transport system kinase
MTVARVAADPAEIARRALGRGRHPVAQLVALLEDVRPAAAGRRDEALAVLEAERDPARGGCVIGVTGSPGSGKSSLLARLAGRVMAADAGITMAMVAVDPSSPTTKGALLGDRTRMNLPPDQTRVFFRSQASATALGGLAPTTFHVCHALSLVFDCVIVETVGVGQSEADIRHLADRVYLVMAPLGGDEIQYLKAGIIEIPDAFVVNKWDEPAATKTYHQLRASLWLARPADGTEIPIHRASAKTGYGIDELADALLRDVKSTASPVSAKAPHFFGSWVREEWGRVGERHLRDVHGGAAELLRQHTGFSAAQAAFEQSMRLHLRE